MDSSEPKRITDGGTIKRSSQRRNIYGGELHVSIRAIHDLPTRDDPSYIFLKVGNETAKTGPPASRHKTYNSFKFGGSASDMVIPAEKLQDLYQETMTLEVVFEIQPARNLKTTFALNQLHVNEEQQLVLDLEAPTPTGNIGARVEEVSPTIQLIVLLEGPFRPEIASLVSMGQTWFGFMDEVERSCTTLFPSHLLPSPSNRNRVFLLVPAVPILTATVVTAPIVIGIMVVFLPVFLPALLAVLTIGTCAVATGLFLYGSTYSGRHLIGPTVELAVKPLLHTQTGQALLFPVGPRPTPVSVARLVLPKGMWERLAVSLLVDAIGSSSYLVPLLGEASDFAWAPIQTAIIMAMYDTTSPNLKYVSFVEEILPFTDVVPSATIGWIHQFGPQLLQGNQINAKEKSGVVVKKQQRARVNASNYDGNTGGITSSEN